MIQKLLVISLALFVVAGCSSQAPDTKASSTSSATGTEAKMEKCAMCGAEYSAADMATHDGKLVCKSCDKAAHGG